MRRKQVHDIKVGQWYVDEDNDLVKIIKSYPVSIWRYYQFKQIKEKIKIFLDNKCNIYKSPIDFPRGRRKNLNKLYYLSAADKAKTKPKNLNKIVKRKPVKNIKPGKHYLACKYIEINQHIIPLTVKELIYITLDNIDDAIWRLDKYSNCYFNSDSYVLCHLTYEDKQTYWPQMIGVNE